VRPQPPARVGPVTADELIGDDHREHDDALGHRHDVRRDARGDVEGVALVVQEREDQCAEGDADRVVAPEERHGDAGETDTRLERGAVAVSLAEEHGHADQSGDRAGEQHGVDHHPLDVDAGRGRGGLRVTRGP
jgi:hypothetical protein